MDDDMTCSCAARCWCECACGAWDDTIALPCYDCEANGGWYLWDDDYEERDDDEED